MNLSVINSDLVVILLMGFECKLSNEILINGNVSLLIAMAFCTRMAILLYSFI